MNQGFKEATPDATTVELYICERCAVWRPQSEVTFDREGALEHALACHPLKLAEVIKAYDTHPFFVAHFIEEVFSDEARFKGGA